MAKILPKWLQRRYLTLRSEFGEEKTFSFKDAQELLEDDSRIVSLSLSELKKHGWLESEPNPKDPRRKQYYLKDLNKTYNEITKKILEEKKTK